MDTDTAMSAAAVLVRYNKRLKDSRRAVREKWG